MITPELAELIRHTGDPAWLLDHDYFVGEGRNVVRRLLEARRFQVDALLLTPPAETAMAPALAAVDAGARPRVEVVPQAELDRLTGFRLHQGCVAFARRRPLPAWDPSMTHTGVSVLLERVRDPDNVGSIMRSAQALGVSTILVGPECADPFYRKAIRTSMGAVFSLTLAAAEPWPEVLTMVKEAGARLVAATPDDTADPIEAVAASTGAGPIVLMVGSEGEGLTGHARQAADIEARIPMANDIDSLNVAVATAVAVYALTRGGCGG